MHCQARARHLDARIQHHINELGSELLLLSQHLLDKLSALVSVQLVVVVLVVCNASFEFPPSSTRSSVNARTGFPDALKHCFVFCLELLGGLGRHLHDLALIRGLGCGATQRGQKPRSRETCRKARHVHSLKSFLTFFMSSSCTFLV